MPQNQLTNQAKPKRFRTAYNFFFQAERLRIQGSYLAEHGHKPSYSVISQLVAERWKAIGVKEKLHFKQLSAMDKCRYGLEMVEWQTKHQAGGPRTMRTKPPPCRDIAMSGEGTPCLVQTTDTGAGGLISFTSRDSAQGSVPSRGNSSVLYSSLHLPEAPRPRTYQWSSRGTPFPCHGDGPQLLEPLAVPQGAWGGSNEQLSHSFDEDDVRYLAELFGTDDETA